MRTNVPQLKFSFFYRDLVHFCHYNCKGIIKRLYGDCIARKSNTLKSSLCVNTIMSCELTMLILCLTSTQITNVNDRIIWIRKRDILIFFFFFYTYVSFDMKYKCFEVNIYFFRPYKQSTKIILHQYRKIGFLNSLCIYTLYESIIFYTTSIVDKW